MEFSRSEPLSIFHQLHRRLQADGSLLSSQEWDEKQLEKPEDEREAATSIDELRHDLKGQGAQLLAREALHGRRDFFQRLLAAGIGASDRDEDGYAPLHLAFLLGRPRMGTMDGPSVSGATRALLEAGADPDALAPDGATPLQLALENGWLSAARELRGAGARRLGALDLAPAPPHEPEASRDVVALFLESGGDLEMSLGGPMQEMDDWEQTIYRKMETWTIEAKHDASTLLTNAVATNDLDLAKALLEAGASREAAGDALHVAASNAAIPTMEWLLSLGWRVNARQDASEASFFGCFWQVNALKDEGETPLERLLERFSLPLDVLNDRRPPDPPSVHLSLSLFAPVGTPSSDDYRRERDKAEHIKQLDRFLPSARFLLEAGAEVRFNALLLAAYDVEMFDLLWPHAPQLSPEAATQLVLRLIYTPESARRPDVSRLRFIEALLKQGADPNANLYSSLPENALYFRAQALNDEPLCRALEAAGANTQLPED